VLWDVNPRDYLGTAPEKMVQTVLEKVKPGSIVLLHDRENTLASLPAMVKGLRAKGYRFVTVDELLKLQR
jgi:peptidoglycan/xylan/chitin deacetylase (PgdA/CDA1 family)